MTTITDGYIKLQADIPALMRFDSSREESREITDPVTRAVKTVTVLVLHTTELDGQTVNLPYSTTSSKHRTALIDLARTGVLYSRVIRITLHPRGYATEYEIHVI